MNGLTQEHITYTGALGKLTGRGEVWRREENGIPGRGNRTCKITLCVKGNFEGFI